MKQVTEFPREIEETADLGITMPDGTRLSARMWKPKDALDKPCPVILEYLPYRKRDGTTGRDALTHPWFAGHGYVCLRVDIRGNGESEGLMDDEYTEQELDDGCEIIAWAAAQPWCNGSVGIMGISWGGFNGLQIAALKPPALKAVITLCSTVDRYADDIHYKGGCLLGENFGWASQMLSYSSRPPDPKLVGDGNWLEMWRHRLENLPYLWKPWHAHQHRDAYWKHGSVCEDYSAIEAAVLSIGGWHDGYRNTISHLVENLDAPVKGIVGPWIHKYPHFAGPQPAIGFLQEAKRWWDKWLKGEETGVEKDPDYRAWLMDSLEPKRWWDERPGRWIAEQQWPSERVVENTYHLSNDGLTEQHSSFERSHVSPQDCGMVSGEFFPFAFSDEFPDEQSHDDERSLCCDGALVSETTDIVGAPEFSAKITCEKPNGLICVRLCDLRPDGTSAFITHGVFNLTHARSHENPEALQPGESIEVKFALDQIAYRLPQGHRLRVAISNAYWPYIWPSPEAGAMTVHSGSVSIPVRPTATGDEWSFDKPEAAAPWRTETLRPAKYSRNGFTDEETGEAILEIDCDHGEDRDLDHGLISGSWTEERWAISADDPLSAQAEIAWENTGGRPGQMWRSETISKMWCDAENFYSTATIRCWHEDDLLFEKDYRETVKRNLV